MYIQNLSKQQNCLNASSTFTLIFGIYTCHVTYSSLGGDYVCLFQLNDPPIKTIIRFNSPVFIPFDSTQTYSSIPKQHKYPPQAPKKVTSAGGRGYGSDSGCRAGKAGAGIYHTSGTSCGVDAAAGEVAPIPLCQWRRHQRGSRGRQRHALGGRRPQHSRSGLVHHRTSSAGNELSRHSADTILCCRCPQNGFSLHGDQ